ncbi:hypothetical protein JW905_19480 [bacterium]|nr:hypothetical protein [candidate division CSSED10-310 bacterium]
MKSAGWFLIKFLVAATVVAPLWYFGASGCYNIVLKWIVELSLPADFILELKDGKLALLHILPNMYLLKPPEFKAALELLTLHFNVVPFLSLFLVTPGVRWRRRLVFILTGFLALSATHVLHIELDYYLKLHQEIHIDTADKTAFLMFLKGRLMLYLQAFMEQAGSMLMPFFLWLLFFNKSIFRFAQTQLLPAGGNLDASPPALRETISSGDDSEATPREGS